MVWVSESSYLDYAINPIMQPVWELVKHSSFTWDNMLNQLFINSKDIISKVQEGIHTFDPQWCTCPQADWSKEGIGYLLSQIYCDCTVEHMPTDMLKAVAILSGTAMRRSGADQEDHKYRKSEMCHISLGD